LGHPTLFTGHLPAGSPRRTVVGAAAGDLDQATDASDAGENLALVASSGAARAIGHSCDKATLAGLRTHLRQLDATLATGDCVFSSGGPMRILVSNDDGIAAQGLRVLVAAARVLTPDVWVVAPERKWTAASHQLSFDRDLSLTRMAVHEYACSGAPADCVVAAMTLLFDKNERPDLVLSGINDKINVGEDLAYSGTMAVAREAAFWGVSGPGAFRGWPRSSSVPCGFRGRLAAARAVGKARGLVGSRVLAVGEPSAQAAGAIGAGFGRPGQDRRRVRDRRRDARAHDFPPCPGPPGLVDGGRRARGAGGGRRRHRPPLLGYGIAAAGRGDPRAGTARWDENG
jgi:5'-nucleotidase